MANITLTDVINHDDFILALGAFFDEFRRNNDRHKLIEIPPRPQAEDIDRVNLCILAAASHKLANDYGINVPEWVNEPLYKMSQPVFAFNTTNKEYQEFLKQDTPYEFASKNIFHGADAIERV